MPQWQTTGLSLQCYPQLPEHVSLPWDAADDYLLSESDKAAFSLILNDRHGALATALPGNLWWSDSFCAGVATQQNCDRNGVIPPEILSSPNLEKADTEVGQVLIRIPKQKEQLAEQLFHIASRLPRAQVLLAGMAKHIPIPLLNWLEATADQYEQLPVVRKARLIRISGLEKFLTSRPGFRSYSINQLQFSAPPGVFCGDRPDPGALVMLKYLPADTKGIICDLGCGNGILAMHLARANPQAAIIATDDSALAVSAARMNAEDNNIKLDVRHGNVLSAVPESLDLVVCNPPFHDGHKQLTSIAEEMFRQSRERLSQNGRMLVVANRHLPYTKTLKRLFRQTSLISDDRRFNIYDCRL